MDIISPEEALVVCSALLINTLCHVAAHTCQQSLNQKRRRRPRRWWVRPIYQNRRQHGDYHNLLQEMRLYDTEMFFHFCRMSVAQFDELLAIIGPYIKKNSQRQPICPGQRLAMTLRFLATGSSQQTLAFQFRVGRSTVCNVLRETTKAIWEVLRQEVFVQPSRENWLRISEDFFTKWNFPHCIGAIDGKHFRVQCPNNTGSEFFNYKKFFSMVLLASCDANYKFTLIDLGGMGSESDGGIFARSTFGKSFEENKLDLPPPSKFNDFSCPYFLVGDEAFPLKDYIMRPYPGRSLTKDQRIFNYRLSRARRIIENTFGILVSRWRLFQGPIIAQVETVECYILAAICLHNYLRMDEGNLTYCPSNYVDSDINGEITLGEWRQQICDSQFFTNFPRTGSNNAKRHVFGLRNALSKYFVSPGGSLPWQNKCLRI